MIVAWWQFYGGAVKNNTVIYLSNSILSESGYERSVEGLVLPHMRHHIAFNIYAKRLNLSQRIRPGRYELKDGMSVVSVVRMLKLGLQSPVEVTFNNARFAENLAGRIARQIEADSLHILNALKSDDLARSVGLKNSAEIISLFIPNTYEMWWTTTPEELIQRMKRESDGFWTAEREAKRKSLKMSRVEVVTLASIVYEECAKESELQRVAGVYVNRLRRGMKLQADPTVKYAMGDFALQRILTRHLSYESPYNTYIHKGVPPSPISIPSIAAIDGVLNYEKHNYLYFCARAEMDGEHNFTASYNQHLINAQRYSKELNRRKIR